MPARYVSVNEGDFHKLFHSSKGWLMNKVRNEVVFDKILNNGAIMRVYTSISCLSGYGREKGKDAIRVVAFNSDRGLFKGPHIKRVSGWQDRLKDRVWDAFNTVKEK
jgi:hypothetical protein